MQVCSVHSDHVTLADTRFLYKGRGTPCQVLRPESATACRSVTKRSLLPFSYHMCREEVAFGRKGKPNIPEPNIQKAFGTRTFSRTGRERTEEHRTAKGLQRTRRTQKTSMPLCTSFSDSMVCQRKNSLNTSRSAHLMPQGRPAATDARRAQRGRVPRTRRPRCAAAPP